MKRLVLALLALALVTPVYAFGKYKSKIEAEEACLIWAASGFWYTYEDTVFESSSSSDTYAYDEAGNYRKGKLKLKTYNGLNRDCQLERETNQYLGFEETAFEKGKHYKEYVYENMDRGLKIKKYFKF